MKVSSSNKALQTLTNKIKRNDIIFTHKLQRRENCWSTRQKSLLLDSLLRGYPVNPVYLVTDEKQAVIDGVQRLSTCYSYVNNGFALSKNLEPVKIGENTYEIAGKKFSKLDEVVRDELMSSQIQVYEITQYTDKEVRAMFSRLNGGKPLNTAQKLTPEMSDELSAVVSDIMSHPFFVKVLTPAQLKSSVDLSIAIEVLMLSEMNGEYDFGSFSKIDKEKFVQYYNDRINTEKVNLIKQALDKINEVFEENVKIPKTSISFVIYTYYRCFKDKKSTSKLTEFVKKFIDEYDSNEEYKVSLQEGTSSAESVKLRLSYWRKVIKEL